MKIATRMILPLFGLGLAFVAAPANARNYDCSKAGNANKTACKAAAVPAPAPLPATKAPTARHYDCSKAGNANKTVCKSATIAPAAPPAPAAKSMPMPTRTVATTSSRSTSTMAAGPNGATARCKDGSYSQSKTHAGTCSHHGGVATWY